MHRVIAGFHQDEVGAWVAELSCLHDQHIHHQPPFWDAPWVLDDAERSQRCGTLIDCSLCDRAELPDGLSRVRSTATWTERTLPAALQRHHRVAPGAWAVLRVERGELRFVASTHPGIDRIVSAREGQAIPPDVDHHLALTGPVALHLEFFRAVDREAPRNRSRS